ncbi:MAG: universal stress protein [Burkholderiales bacterium]|nr:universal stress protein [Burkholderiales bacterium]
MTYKTILVHVDQSDHRIERMRIASRLALTQGAHLIGAAMTGISRLIYEAGMISPNDPSLSDHIEVLRERAMRSLDSFEVAADKAGITSFEKRLVDDEASGGISLQARYADLVVVSQTDLDDTASGTLPDFPEYVVLNSARPVLIVPYAGQFHHVGEKVLIAWDGSMEATRAVTNAIPMLKQAKLVQVAVFNAASRPNVHGAQPGADIALYLARHGIRVEVTEQKSGIDVGESLLTLASDESSDLIVMGGYGHTRFRETVLGGVTRTVLDSMTVPVLMSH